MVADALLPCQLEGPHDVTLARRQAESTFGAGGRLFKEVETPSEKEIVANFRDDLASML